jgi:hypothetical protein
MSESTRRPLSSDAATLWAASAQLYFLDALMADSSIQEGEIAFHGGTSLHFIMALPAAFRGSALPARSQHSGT